MPTNVLLLALAFLLKVEGEGYHFAMGFLGSEGVREHALVLYFASVALVVRVQQTIHELKFWAQLEEGKVEVATYTYFHEEVSLLQAEVFVLVATQVHHRIQACHDVGAVIVKPWGGKDEVEGARDVCCLQLLAHVIAVF